MDFPFRDRREMHDMPDRPSLIQDLESAISTGTPEKRLQALIRITDLFLAGSGLHSQEQEELFDELFLRLVETIETQARAELSRRLASACKTPPRILRSLAFDDAIAVAAPMLSGSAQLTDEDLIESAKSKSQDHLQAITRRATLSEPVTDALIERGNDRVVRLVVKNAGARISDGGFGKIVGKAANDESLARFVGARRDIPRHHFLKLLESASAAARDRLIAGNPELAAQVRMAVTEVASEISGDVRNASPAHARAKARVKRLYRTGQFCEADLHAFARAKDFEQTALALAALGEFPIDLVERALVDQTFDTILILVKAAKCCRATVRAVLLLRGMSAMDLESALMQFERLQVSTARQTLEFYHLRRRQEDGRAPNQLVSYAESARARGLALAETG
jgi:uncharacterized protein (DUF2336 family)